MAVIAHLADTHIRNLRYHKEYREVFDKLFKRLRKEKVDYIIHCGDIAHSKTQISPEFVKMCSEFLLGLSSVAPTYVILGNHDGNLKNSNRQDAITPIVEALGHPNLFLLKNSGETKIDGNHTLNVLSVFDRDNWIGPTDPNAVNIALYHGAISNSRTDLGWLMEHGEDDISIFKGHDFAFLGDIHKTNQSLDHEGRIRYAGSTVQQNFGETNDKGFLLWDIRSKNDFSVKHISIPNPKPFVTIGLTKKGRLPKNAKCPMGARLRLVSSNNIPLHTMKRAIDAAQHRFKPERITFLNRAAGERGSVEEQANTLAVDNLRDVSVQEDLIKEYLKDYHPTNEQMEKVFELNKKYNTAIKNGEEAQRNVNWRLSRITWDNLFNYGEANSIDFTNLTGIVGIFGKNYSGKSSVIDSLLYILFNSTSKNERKNLNIINQNRQQASGKAYIVVGAKEYCIERESEKYVKKLKGEETLEAKTNVNFFVRDLATDEVRELNGTTRNETDKIIRNHFGSLEDFLLTSMSSQLGALQFISEGSTKRKEILAKFLDLEVFDRKYRLAKEDATDLRGALKRKEGVSFDDDIYEAEKRLAFLENETDHQNELCDTLQKDIEELKTKSRDIKDKIGGMPAEVINIYDIKKKIKQKRKDQERLAANTAKCDQIIHQNNSVLAKITAFSDDFSVGKYKEEQGQINQILSDIAIIDKELENAVSLEKANENKLSLLQKVPCGDKYPTCRFIKDAICASENAFSLRQRVEEIQKEKSDKERHIEGSDIKKIEKYIQQHEQVMQRKSDCEKKNLEAQLEKEKWQNNILTSQKALENLLLEEEKYEESKDIIENKELFIKQLREIDRTLLKKEDEREECQQVLLECYKEHGSIEQRIKMLKEQKEELEALREEYEAYDLFMSCMHSNGIAYDIIKKKLPIINEEIAKILANIVDFEIFFEADDRRLNIFIKHPRFEQRPIEMGSGAEKTLAAMAIRLSLLTVSSLPKSDIFILDEPGTALDVDNMDGFISILELIKTYFKTVILISHLDHLKDCVDQQIVIDKKGGLAHITI